MATSIKKQVQAARAKRSKLVDAIYANAAHPHMVFTECLDRSPATLQIEYAAIGSKLVRLEHDAVVAGKAWWNALGQLVWYR